MMSWYRDNKEMTNVSFIKWYWSKILKIHHIYVQKYQRFVVMDPRNSDLSVLCLDTVKICHIIVPIYYTEVIVSEKNICNAVGKTYLDINTL